MAKLVGQRWKNQILPQNKVLEEQANAEKKVSSI
jgi:hypothetical protein